MKILDAMPTAKNPAERFWGDVWTDVVSMPQDAGQVAVVAKVRFAPGARTAWHSHAVGQTLYITEGVALAQTRGGEIVEIHAGQVLYTEPGEVHWHGAAPDRFMEHIAITENGEDPLTTTTWFEHVSDEEYFNR